MQNNDIPGALEGLFVDRDALLNCLRVIMLILIDDLLNRGGPSFSLETKRLLAYRRTKLEA